MSNLNQDAIALITAATQAHEDLDDPVRFAAFLRDTQLILADKSPKELGKLIMVLSVMNSSLIDLGARLGHQSPEELLRWIALQHGAQE